MSHPQASGMDVLIIEDSPVFALFAAHAVTSCLPEANIARCATYATAAEHLRDSGCGLVVCGFGVGDGRTAHDVRSLTTAPMVVLTGRPGAIPDLPSDSRLVYKGAGPDALCAAIQAAVSA